MRQRLNVLNIRALAVRASEWGETRAEGGWPAYREGSSRRSHPRVEASFQQEGPLAAAPDTQPSRYAEEAITPAPALMALQSWHHRQRTGLDLL